MSLEFVQYPAQGTHKATVIWLHGLGDSGDGFAPVAPQLDLPSELGVRFIFPHAPMQAVTINGGMQMRSWYDIKSMDLDKNLAVALNESALYLGSALGASIGGFALALHMPVDALSFAAGLVALLGLGLSLWRQRRGQAHAIV